MPLLYRGQWFEFCRPQSAKLTFSSSLLLFLRVYKFTKKTPSYIKHILEFAWRHRVTVRKMEYLRIALIGQAERVFEKNKNKKFLEENNVDMENWKILCHLSHYIKSRL